MSTALNGPRTTIRRRSNLCVVALSLSISTGGMAGIGDLVCRSSTWPIPRAECARWSSAVIFTRQAECSRRACPVQPPGHFHEGREKGSMWAIGAYWYPWYGADRRHWDRSYMGTPWLGRYDSANQSVIRRQIEWAKWCGIDFFAASWWGINSYEDKVLRQPFLAEAQSAEFQFAILYESLGLLASRESQIDLSLRHNQGKLVADFRYLARHYFRHPNYFCVNGRPVVFVNLTRIMVGDIAHALRRVREAVKTESGKELFLIGDEVYWHHPTAERLRLFDAVTAYNMHSSSAGIAEGGRETVLRQFYLWAKQASAVQGLTLKMA